MKLNAPLIVMFVLGTVQAKHIRNVEDVTANDLEEMRNKEKSTYVQEDHALGEGRTDHVRWTDHEGKIPKDVKESRTLEDTAPQEAEGAMETFLTTTLNNIIDTINNEVQGAIPEPVEVDLYHEDKGKKCVERLWGNCILKYDWWYKVWVNNVYNAKSFMITNFTNVDASAIDFNNVSGTLSIKASSQVRGAKIDGKVSAGVKKGVSVSATGKVEAKVNVDGEIDATMKASPCEKAGKKGIGLNLVDLGVDITDADLYGIDIDINNDLWGMLGFIVENVVMLVQELGVDIGKLIGNEIEDPIAEKLETELANEIEDCYTF